MGTSKKRESGCDTEILFSVQYGVIKIKSLGYKPFAASSSRLVCSS
ncbi:hypothetical protein [Symbiopectobacterium sp. RP]